MEIMPVYKPLQVIGPEHEFSVVGEDLKTLPIIDKIIKDFCGRTVNFVEQPKFTFGKELQLHAIELKANAPFASPKAFEQTMQDAVIVLSEFLLKKYHARFLGTGMHPLLRLNETQIWPHRHKGIYREYGKVFNLNQHGWLNIQSFHLNLPYSNERWGILIHNLLAGLCAYLPAISASSPICEGELGKSSDGRLQFYKNNQREIPSITGDVIPELATSFNQYRRGVIERYSEDMAKAGIGEVLLFKEWVNSRGVIFRFDRRALEVRVIDEQECVKSDVALSCFVRASLRGLISDRAQPLPHDMLVNDFNSVISKGLDAKVHHPKGGTAKKVCQFLLKIAKENADENEKEYLWLIEKRINGGSLSDLIRERVSRKAHRTTLEEAIRSVYSKLVRCLADNQPYF